MEDVLETIKEAAQPGALVSSAMRALQLMTSTPETSRQAGQHGTQNADALAERRMSSQGASGSSASIASSAPKPSQLAEGAAVLSQELKSPSGKTATDTGEVLEEKISDPITREKEQANTRSYGSAAAFLGFRLPGWTKSLGGENGGAGIGHAERLLSRLWTDRNSLAAKEARRRLEQVLETYTDVTRFPCPKQPQAAVLVGAMEDAYVARQSIKDLAAHWPGSEVRWVPGGHVSAFLLQQAVFRDAISDSLDRLKL